MGTPQLDAANNLINIDMDGTFFDQALGTNHVGQNTMVAHRVAGLASNQAFIHRDTIVSGYYSLKEKILPLHLDNQLLLMLFPELRFKYGGTVQEQLVLDLSVDSKDFIYFNASSGLELGKRAPVNVDLKIMCKNDRMTDYELAVEFTLNFELVASFFVD